MKRSAIIMRGFIGLSVGLIMVAVLIGSAYAQFAQDTPTNRQARNLGMGNVGLSITGSADSSPFYNPAGLNDVEEGRFKFLGITAEIANNSLGLATDVKDFADDIDNANTNPERIDAFDRFVADRQGEYQKLRFMIEAISYARKNFAVGLLLVDEQLDASFRDPAFPNFQLQNHGDITPYISGAYGFWDKLLQVGISFRPTIRFSLDEEDQLITYADVIAPSGQDPPFIDAAKKLDDPRFGLAVDVGLKSDLNFPVLKDMGFWQYLKPQLGFAWTNMGTPSFDQANGSKQSIGVGLSIEPNIWKLKNTVALEFQDLNFDNDTLSKLHFGVETKLPWVVAVRAGVNQGYFSGGLSLDLWVAVLEGAVYWQEIGVHTRESGNLRYVGALYFKI